MESTGAPLNYASIGWHAPPSGTGPLSIVMTVAHSGEADEAFYTDAWELQEAGNVQPWLTQVTPTPAPPHIPCSVGDVYPSDNELFLPMEMTAFVSDFAYDFSGHGRDAAVQHPIQPHELLWRHEMPSHGKSSWSSGSRDQSSGAALLVPYISALNTQSFSLAWMELNIRPDIICSVILNWDDSTGTGWYIYSRPVWTDNPLTVPP